MSDFQKKFKNILPPVGGNYYSNEHFRTYQNNKLASKACIQNVNKDKENKPNMLNWFTTQIEVHGFNKRRNGNKNFNFLSNGNDYSSSCNYTNDCVGSVLGSGDSGF